MKITLLDFPSDEGPKRLAVEVKADEPPDQVCVPIMVMDLSFGKPIQHNLRFRHIGSGRYLLEEID